MPAGDLSPLGSRSARMQALQWLRPEVQAAAQRIRRAVEVQQEQDADPIAIKAALQEIRQLEGALELGQLHGPSQLASHIRACLQDLLHENVEDSGEALATVGTATLWLAAWVDGTELEAPESAAVAQPLVAALHAVSRKPAPTEAELFLRQMQLMGLLLQAPEEPARVEGAAMVVARKLLLPFQTLLLQWLKGQDVPRTLAKLHKVAEQVAINATSPVSLTLWVACAAAIDSMLLAPGAESAELKRCFGRMGQQFKALAERGEEGNAETLEVTWRLVAHAAPLGTPGPYWKLLFEGLPLASTLPLPAVLAAQRQRLQGPDAALLEHVGSETRRELGRIKDGIDLAVRAGALEGSVLASVREQFALLASTLQLLRLEPEAAQLRQLAASPLVNAEEVAGDDPALLPLAEALLRVEQALQTTGGRLASPHAANASGPHPRELHRARVVLARELRVNLARLKASLDATLKGAAEVAADPLQLLQQTATALRLASAQRAGDQVLHLRDYLALHGSEGLKRQPAQAAVYAEAITLLELVLGDFAEGINERWLDALGQRIEQLSFGAPAVVAAPAEPEPLTLAATEVAAEQAPAAEAIAAVEAPEPLPETAAPAAGEEPEIQAIFLEEAREVCATLEGALPRLKREASVPEALALIRRSFHTLKGSGRMVGANTIGDLAWAMEHLLNRCLEGALPFNDTVQAVLAEGVGLLPTLLANAQAGNAVAETLVERVRFLASGRAPEMVDAEVLAIFREDALERLQSLQDWLAAGTPRTQGQEVMRALHTLKGSAAAVNAFALGELAGAFEALFDAVRASGDAVPPAASELLAEALPTLRTAVADAGSARTLQTASWLAQIEPLLAALAAQGGQDPQLAREAFSDSAFETLQQLETAVLAWSKLPAEAALGHALAESAVRLADAAGSHKAAALAELLVQFSEAVRDVQASAEPLSIAPLAERVEPLFQALDSYRMGEAQPLLQQPVLPQVSLNAGPEDGVASALPDAEASVIALPQSFELGLLDEPVVEVIAPAPTPEDSPATLAEPVAEAALPEQPAEAAPEPEVVAEAAPVAEEAALPAEAVPVDTELLAIFTTEAAEHLDALRGALPGLRNGEVRALLSVRHSLHTFAGSAHMAGQTTTAEAASQLLHALEGCTGTAAELAAAAQQVEQALPALGAESPAVAEAEEPAAEIASEPEPELQPEPAPEMLLPPEFASRPEPAESDAGEVDADLAAIFAAEAAEILEQLDAALAEWRSGKNAQAPAQSLQRSLHTLKGGARILGFMHLGSLAHEMESRVEQLAHKRSLPDASEFEELRVRVLELERQHDALMRGHYSALLKAVSPQASEPAVFDERSQLPAAATLPPVPLVPPQARTLPPAAPAVPAPTPPPVLPPIVLPASTSRPPQPWRQELFASEPEEAGSSAPRELARVGVDVLDSLLKQAGEVSIVRARVEQQNNALTAQLGEVNRTVLRLREQLRQMDQETEAQIAARGISTGAVSAQGDFDPLELDRYTRMQEISRALNETVADLAALHGSLDEMSEETGTLLRQQGRINTTIQQGLMESLMVPFSRQMPRLERLVRLTAEQEQKSVRVLFEGSDAELDRNVLERITPALEHLLRNAVVHGIESRAARTGTGKAAEGSVTVSAKREGAQLLLEVFDDGKGLDFTAIRSIAVSRGLLPANAELPEDELARFIFQHGFSTAEKLTQNAGRGVGMDVVAAEIKLLGGTLELRSTPGQGTRFAIRLPLSLALSQALMVGVNGETYALPITAIEGIARLPQSFSDVAPGDESAIYSYAGRDYSVRFLADLIQQPRAAAAGRSLAAVLVKQSATVDGQERRSALIVEQLLGNQEIVSRPVGRLVSAIRGVAGATILPGGEVVLILDASTLLEHRTDLTAIHSAAHAAERAAADAEAALAALEGEVKRVLVVDDSVTIRRVAERLLTRQGYQVLTAKDGVDAMTLLHTETPHAILLDIEMPRADGFEVAGFVRNNARIAHTPIIMITSRSGDKHRARAKQLGVNGYLIKPWQEDRLLQELRELLAQSQGATA